MTLTTWVQPLDPDRAAWMQAALGTSLVPVTAPEPEMALVLGVEAPVYWLDLAALTDESRDRLLEALCQRFGVPIDQGWAELQQGVPIIAGDLVVVQTYDLKAGRGQ